MKKRGKIRLSNNNKQTLDVTSSPHIKNPETTSTIMLDVIIALIPAAAWGVYVFGKRALAVILMSVLSAVLFEGLYQHYKHIPLTIKDGSAVVTGLLLALCLPVSVPIWIPVVGSFFAIVVVKQLFGGIGKNIVNPAVAARAFLLLICHKMMTFYTAPYTKLPLIKNVSKSVGVSPTPLSYLNEGKLPECSLFDAILGNVSGTIGEVSVVLLFVGGIYLLIRKTIKWYIPVSYISTVVLLSLMFPQVNSTFAFTQFEVFSGGLILGAIFMATDYATSPVTKWGRIIYGIGCGVLTVIIRFCFKQVEAVPFAILIMNFASRYLDIYIRPSKVWLKKRTK